MEGICEEYKCTGCGACVNICPQKCITFIANKNGIKLPRKDFVHCIPCGLCVKVCPQNASYNEIHPKKCYAVYMKNKIKRLDCASGGVATLLYEAFLEINKDAKIFGVEYNDDFEAIFSSGDSAQDIKVYKGSKYVQADTGLIYKEIAEALLLTKSVLLIALPCQIAACRSYLLLKKISINKLVTVDLLCHGVSPSKYLIEELNYLKNKYNWKRINELTFRSNRKFKNFHFCVSAIKQNGKKAYYNRYSNEDPYFWGFLEGITLRESCYSCRYASIDRVSDITIGDFIGLGKLKSSEKFQGNSKNASVLLCNTDKSKLLINQIKDKVHIYERNLAELAEGGTSLQQPFPRSKYREIFLDNYENSGFIKAMNLAVGENLKKMQRKYNLIRPIKQLLIDNKIARWLMK